jgi:hypothetical protein
VATYASGEQLSSAKANHVGTCIARARRTSVSPGSTSSTDAGVLRLDSIPIRANIIYRIPVYCHPDSTVATDGLRVQIRYRDDGIAAATSDAVLPDAIAFVKIGNPLFFEVDYSVSIDQNLSILLCVARTSGSGTATLYADGVRSTTMRMFACGIDPGDTGVDLP